MTASASVTATVTEPVPDGHEWFCAVCDPPRVLAVGLLVPVLYVGLLINGEEISGAGYGRAPLRAADLSVPDSEGRSYNTVAVAGPVALEAWGNPTHVGIYDVPTGGAPLLDGSWEGGPIGIGQLFWAGPGKITLWLAPITVRP